MASLSDAAVLMVGELLASKVYIPVADACKLVRWTDKLANDDPDKFERGIRAIVGMYQNGLSHQLVMMSIDSAARTS